MSRQRNVNALTPALESAMKEAFGPQRVSVSGVPATSHFARVLVAADVYGVAPHVGRGGWTWYTGSASWLYRVGLESLLGFRRTGDWLTFDPRLPTKWPGFSLEYRHGSATYRVRVENHAGVEQGVRRVTLDGQEVEDGVIPLTDDGREHEVFVEMG